MHLYLVSQTTETDYDYYDKFVVVANDEFDARTMTPDGEPFMRGDALNPSAYWTQNWCAPEYVKVVLLGQAEAGLVRGEVILATKL